MIACVGDVMVDVFAEPGSEPRTHPGGKACIYAVTIRALGLPAAVVGSVGDDDDWRTVRAALTGGGVDVSAVRVDPEAATGADFLKGGDWRMERGANWRLSPEHVRAALAGLPGGLTAAIVNQGVPAPAAEAAIELVRTAGVLLVVALAPEAVEPARRIDPSRCAAADLVVVTPVEADVLLTQLGRPAAGQDEDEDDEQLLRRVFDATRPRFAAVLSRGPGGATAVLADGSACRVPGPGAVGVEPERRIGAGDVLVAATVAELVADGGPVTAAGLTDALAVGVSAAAASLDYRGTLTGPVNSPERFRRLGRAPGTRPAH